MRTAWRVAAALVAGLLIAAAAFVGWQSWQTARQVAAFARAHKAYEFPPYLQILGATQDTVTYRDTDGGAPLPDYMALHTSVGGWAETTSPVGAYPVQRTIERQAAPPSLAAGQEAWGDVTYFYADPRQGLGLPYTDVDYGAAEAWLVPGQQGNPTWMIFVHGLGGVRAEGLRALSVANAQGCTSLLISYQNDQGSDAGNGYVQFGADEWHDLEQAVRYALGHGAQNVVLVGNSHGGAVTLGFLVNSRLVDKVSSAFLDDPVTDFDALLAQTTLRNRPSWARMLARPITTATIGLDWSAIDYNARAAEVTTPTTIVVGGQDLIVPPAITADFAAAANRAHPGLVDLQFFPNAPHTGEWNADRPRFETLLSARLQAAIAGAGS